MRIVITDGYTLNPGDLTWEDIAKFGQITHYDRSDDAQTVERCRNAEIILTNKTPITRHVIAEATALKLICVTATGYNIVDIDSARQRKITVCNVPDYGTASVAQHTFALILELSNLAGSNSTAVAAGRWVQSPDFCFSVGKLTELKGKTIGLVGFGKIGQQVARLARAFEMNVVYFTRTKKETALASYTELKTLFSICDIVSLHCPLTKDNNEFVDLELLSIMKPTAWLINTSRGQLINELHLNQALASGSLAYAAVDVLSKEPPVATNPLLTAPNCLITPHTAWISREARSRILSATASNIAGFLAGAPVNVV
ncbi:MAG TPA: D-2-hydroxyacid dehydrogenase [Chryseolinea sp.]|nr:D-2-hydroxyacid dehydrogenase [Chryseolinea sp.]